MHTMDSLWSRMVFYMKIVVTTACFVWYPAAAHSDSELLSQGKEAARTVTRDCIRIISSPFRLSRETLPEAAAVTGLILASSSLDREGRDRLEGWDSQDIGRIHDIVEPFGRVRSIYGLGAVIVLGGYTSGRAPTIRCGLECIEAGFVTTQLTVFLKHATGRLRPGATSEPYRFHPFRKGNAFPSSHAVQAFAAASVLTEYTPFPADCILFAVASTVAVFDLSENRHWVSDVTAGAFLGIIVGKTLVRGHETSSHRSTSGRLRVNWGMDSGETDRILLTCSF